MKKLLFLLLAVFLNATIVDMVVVSVNKEPITSYEVVTLSKKLHIPYKEALNLLIDKKLFDDAIKEQGISVDEFDIENALEKIASSYGMSVYEFKRMLKEKGEWREFEKKLKEKLLRDKFIKEYLNSKISIDDKEIKEYYNSHKSEFEIFKKAKVIVYKANNPALLEKVIRNPFKKVKGVVVEQKTITPKELNLKELFVLKNTPIKSFSPILDKGIYYETFYVASKEGKTYIPFDKVKDIIANKLIQKKEKEALNSYIARLRSEASIQFYNP
jgi:hypothetical protein